MTSKHSKLCFCHRATGKVSCLRRRADIFVQWNVVRLLMEMVVRSFMGSWFEIGRRTGGSSRVDNVAILEDLINLEQEVRKLEVAITFVQVFVFRIQLTYIQSMG
ncbi:hypothetical protein QCA50_014238 [Cerrena zonata]|uniref:Uncharacterized protein n=1 Tax=Cerrena zonata TaxID=2478898 RepID=A0AAW0FMI1_9APHY